MVDWLEVLQIALSIVSAVCAGMAARKWYEASNIELPPHTGDSWGGQGPFSDALAKQSKMNATAAIWATASAGFQTFAISAWIVYAILVRHGYH
jgi:hypothetical protein